MLYLGRSEAGFKRNSRSGAFRGLGYGDQRGPEHAIVEQIALLKYLDDCPRWLIGLALGHCLLALRGVFLIHRFDFDVSLLFYRCVTVF